MTKYTPNYNLDLYEETDIPNLADQYNAAVGKIDTAVHDVHGEVVETANKLITINETIARLNTQITEVNAELTALGTEVNAELTALGITDAEGAAALLTTINANVEGVAKIPGLEERTTENTNKLMDVGGTLAEVQADYLISDFNSLQTAANPAPHTYDMGLIVNTNNTGLKMFGNLIYTPGTYDLQPIPGTSFYGIKITPSQPLNDVWKNRAFTYSGCTYLQSNDDNKNISSLLPTTFRTGSDGNIYAAPTSRTQIVVPDGKIMRVVYWQALMLAKGQASLTTTGENA